MLLDTSEVEKVDFSEWDIVHAGSVSQAGFLEVENVCKISGKREAV